MEEKHRYTSTYSPPNYKDRNNRPKRLKMFTEFPTLSLWQRLDESLSLLTPQVLCLICFIYAALQLIECS